MNNKIDFLIDLYLQEDFFIDKFFQEQKLAWKKRVADGTLSDKGVERVRQAGLIKPKSAFLRGVEKGSNKLIDRVGGDVMKHRVANVMGPMTMQGTVVLPKGDPWFFRMLSKLKGLNLSKAEWNQVMPLLKRHEADELRVFYKRKLAADAKAKRLAQRVKKSARPNTPINTMNDFNKQMIDVFGPKPYDQSVKFQKGKKTVGLHASPEVLQREKRLATTYNRLYPNTGTQKFIKHRHKTGEYGKRVQSANPKKVLKQMDPAFNKLTQAQINKVSAYYNVAKGPWSDKLQAFKNALKQRNVYKKALKGVTYAL